VRQMSSATADLLGDFIGGFGNDHTHTRKHAHTHTPLGDEDDLAAHTDEAHVPSRRLSAPQIGSSVRVGQRIQQMAGNERNVVQIAGNVRNLERVRSMSQIHDRFYQLQDSVLATETTDHKMYCDRATTAKIQRWLRTANTASVSNA